MLIQLNVLKFNDLSIIYVKMSSVREINKNKII